MTTDERFWSYVQKGTSDECWLWMGTRLTKKLPYGQFNLGNRKRVYAHRYAVTVTIATGVIPDGVIVRHTCDNPPCCNPNHLRLGTYKDNWNDAFERRRYTYQHREHCPYGHLYSGRNINGWRICATCQQGAKARYRGRCRTAAYTVASGIPLGSERGDE